MSCKVWQCQQVPGSYHDDLQNLIIVYSRLLKSKRLPGPEHVNFLSGVRQASYLPPLDRVHKFVRDAVLRLVDVLAHITHDGEKFMFQIIGSQELQDIDLVL